MSHNLQPDLWLFVENLHKVVKHKLGIIIQNSFSRFKLSGIEVLLNFLNLFQIYCHRIMNCNRLFYRVVNCDRFCH